MKVVSGSFRNGRGRLVLDTGKVFEWTYHVGLLTGPSDIEKAILKAATDLVDYCSDQIVPPLPGSDRTVGGPA